MIIKMPEKVNYIIKELQDAGYEAFAVGGCIRDSVLGREPQDWDITTSARPAEIKEVFGYTIDTGIAHGTVTVMLDHQGFEVTTYRIDGEYEDARHPKDVVFTSNLREDLKRRDFTINAMAYNDRAGLVDAFDGLGDLKRGQVRCVGAAKERFTEDALRILRAVRFQAQLGFTIEEQTKQAIMELAPNLKKISAERIRTELVKLLISPHPEAMRDVWSTGIADVILPEFSVMMTTGQNNPHHCGTVGEHTIRSLQEVPPKPVLRLAMLLHDVGKPCCITTDEKGIMHFHGHPQVGETMANQIMKRLKFDNDTIRRVRALVRFHDDRPWPLTEKTVRRAIVRAGKDQYPDLFVIKRADILAQSSLYRKEKLDYVDRYEELYHQIMQKQQCLSLKDLAVTGSDLIAAGMKPGREIGMVLNQMLQEVIDDPQMNRKELLMEKFVPGRVK